jgi:hypothetical protein
MGIFKSSSSTLFCLIVVPPDGELIRLAIPEMKRSRMTKKGPRL